MTDNYLRIAFDYKYPDEAALVIYTTFGGGFFLGSEPKIDVRKIITGEKAVKLYSELTGKSIEEVHKEAGYKYNG